MMVSALDEISNDPFYVKTLQKITNTMAKFLGISIACVGKRWCGLEKFLLECAMWWPYGKGLGTAWE